ncbi:putative transposase [Cocos nucifera]|uniref:Putative transposase n=1 Tax=Cocos nucifera TaxID=13894 RepID=A0A8K0MVK7_COCNU|nr:putative transposase [Cocos nucifera]
MTRDVLVVPVSTVASESAFSTSSKVLDNFRSSPSPKMTEALICTQNWLRSIIFGFQDHEFIENLEQCKKIEAELASGNGGAVVGGSGPSESAGNEGDQQPTAAD